MIYDLCSVIFRISLTSRWRFGMVTSDLQIINLKS